MVDLFNSAEEKAMTMTLRELMCAMALCGLAWGVQAQSTDTSKMTSPKSDMTSPKSDMTSPKSDMTAKSDADYKAAKAACDAKTGADKDKCMKDADMAHAKAMKGSSASSSTKDMSSGSSKDMSSGSTKGMSSGSGKDTSSSTGSTPK
jgi:hypothetical protein